MTGPDQWVLWAACGCPALAAPVTQRSCPWRHVGLGTRVEVVAADKFRREVLPALTAPCPHAAPPPAEVDADVRHAMVLAQALGEITAVSPDLGSIAARWLRGELPKTRPESLAYMMHQLPQHLDDARDTVLVAVWSRADRHAAQNAESGSDGDR